jgi:hypothetical protein
MREIGSMKARTRAALATTTVLASAAALLVGVSSSAHAAVWPGFGHLVAHSQTTVGSVTTMVEIFTGANRNSYYGKVNCVNTNKSSGEGDGPGSTVVRAYNYSWMSGYIYSYNVQRFVAFMASDSTYQTTDSYGHSPGFYAWNDTLEYWGRCEYHWTPPPPAGIRAGEVIAHGSQWVNLY